MQNNVVSLTSILEKRNHLGNNSDPMTNEEDFKPETCSRYIVEGESIAYTKTGYPYYKGLFAQAGINIDNVSTVSEFTKALDSCKVFEIEYAIQFGESEVADLKSRKLTAILNGDFDEAERLRALINRKENLKVV